MKYTLKKEDKYTYLESGEGSPLIILHGLMGNLSNFDGVFIAADGTDCPYSPSCTERTGELVFKTQELLKEKEN